MQKKLTLRMDSEVIESAKKVADERNVSLSRMVSDYFTALKAESPTGETSDLPPRTRSLYGALISDTEIDEKSEYRDFLEDKYS